MSNAFLTGPVFLSIAGLIALPQLITEEGCGDPDPEPTPTPGLCEGADPQGEPFAAGPYGIDIWDTVGDFTVPTLDGDFSLAASWTGCDSYIFLGYRRDWDYATSLWNSSISDLLQSSPDNVHYLVMSYDTGAHVAEDITALKAKVDQAISRLPAGEQAHWQERFHYVTTGGLELGNWISERLAQRAAFSIAVDRLQRLREAGGLYELTPLGLWRNEIYTVALEADAYNFEWTREQRLKSDGALEVPVFQDQPVSDPSWAGVSVFADVQLPDAAAMAQYDTLEVDLGLYCPGHIDENCPDWDYKVGLYLCDRADPARCDTVFARWITTYGREGRWVTDISPMLSLVADGGPRRFRFYSTQYYDMDLSFRLSNRGKGARAVEAQYLFSGGAFNQDYNEKYAPVSFTVPSDVKRVELHALITGHGWGTEVENCAEFCNHDHHFVVNGVDHVKAHPEAGTQEGCVEQVGAGTVPNQYGTWPYGRGGWCPGMDVVPWVVDLTDVVVKGESNTIRYQGLFEGQPYVPTPSGSTSGFSAEIDMQSWLVFYR